MKEPYNVIPAVKIGVIGGELLPDFQARLHHHSSRKHGLSVTIHGPDKRERITIDLGRLPLRDIQGTVPIDPQELIEPMIGRIIHEEEADQVRDIIVMRILLAKLVHVTFDLKPGTPICTVQFAGIDQMFVGHEYSPAILSTFKLEDCFLTGAVSKQ